MAETRISLNRLARLVAELPARRIARLPLDRLPESIPEHWCEQFADDKREALLSLARALADPEARRQARSALTARIAGATHWVLEPDTLANWLDSVEQGIGEAESLLQRWREGNGGLRRSGLQASPASLQSEIELSSGGEVRLQDLEHVCGTLQLSFNGRQDRINQYVRLLKSLRKAQQADYGVPRLAAAIEHAEHQLARLTGFLSRYRLLRLTLAAEEMGDCKRRIEAMSRRRLELDANLQTLRHELRMAESWSGRLKGGRRADPQALQRNIAALESELGQLTVPIADEQIYAWLNQLVDAVLDDYCQQIAQSLVDRSRALFVSLLKYRRRYSSAPDLNAGDAQRQARRDDATRELQALVSGIFGARSADPVKSVTEPDAYRRSVDQLKNQIVQELLAATTPRLAIGS